MLLEIRDPQFELSSELTVPAKENGFDKGERSSESSTTQNASEQQAASDAAAVYAHWLS
jgi:hypothetical protein